jgi:PTH1 family peptidyl-tRNA hydrolase
VIELVAFLGNPGKEYSGNRHNVGFMLAEKLPFYGSLSWQNKFKGLYAAGAGTASRLHFIKPQTYMNLSGQSVFQAAAFFKIKNESILLVHDELELPLGTIALKFSGGLGGHNGLRSMKKCFGTADFWRLRIGIGRPDNRKPGEGGAPAPKAPKASSESIVDWVLSDFEAAEEETLGRVLAAGAELLVKTFETEPAELLGEWAKRKIPLEDPC